MRLYAYEYVVYISEINWKFCVLVNTIQYSFDDDACACYIPALLILQFRYFAYSVGISEETDGSTFQKGFEEYENASFIK